MSAITAAFGKPFREQVAFFRQKVAIPSEHYDDLIHAQHDRGFIVAGAMKAELVNDLRNAIRAAIEDGETLAAFRNRFDSIVQKHGWTEWAGEGTADGVAWRTRVIYATNLRTSYAAGRWAQMTSPDTLATRPFWRYRHNTVEHPRMEHKRWDGLVLPAGDEWFQTHYPPNGWGCKCRVETLSRHDMEKLGKTGPDARPEGGSAQVMSSDGRAVTVPDGVGYGWGYAPGATWHPDLNRYPMEVAKALVAENVADGVFDRWLTRIEGQVQQDLNDPFYKQFENMGAKQEQKDTLIKEQLRQRLGTDETFPIAVLTPEQQKLLGIQTQVLLFSNYDAVKQAYSRAGNVGFDHAAYRQVQGLLDNARLIVRQDGDRSMTTVWVEVEKGKNYMAVLQQTKTGKGLFLKSFRLSAPNDLERAKKKGKVLFERG